VIPCHPKDVAPFDSPAMLYTRLTDSAPAIVTVCAWHEDLTDPKHAGISHGICPACVAKLESGGAVMRGHATDGIGNGERFDDNWQRDAVEDAVWEFLQRAIARDIARQDAAPSPLLPVGPPIAHAVTERTPDGWRTTGVAGAPTEGVTVDVICIPFPAALEGI